MFGLTAGMMTCAAPRKQTLGLASVLPSCFRLPSTRAAWGGRPRSARAGACASPQRLVHCKPNARAGSTRRSPTALATHAPPSRVSVRLVPSLHSRGRRVATGMMLRSRRALWYTGVFRTSAQGLVQLRRSRIFTMRQAGLKRSAPRPPCSPTGTSSCPTDAASVSLAPLSLSSRAGDSSSARSSAAAR
eukprot:2155434-Pleurochrysis_carterae.AAC.2